MTKQEYEAALKYAMDTDRPPWRDIAIHQAKNNYIASLEAENAALTAENAKLEKLTSAALERLSYHACPSDRNNYGQPCNDSDDCVACWREYFGGKDE
jgi:hypothetical protein